MSSATCWSHRHRFLRPLLSAKPCKTCCCGHAERVRSSSTFKTMGHPASLKHGLQAILASGTHATYDENEPASAISAQIERELAAEGITVLPFRKISFEEAS
jgi:hypothetical protein